MTIKFSHISVILLGAYLASSVHGADSLSVLRSQDSPYQLRASDLLGMDVINLQDEEIGEIDDLTVGKDGSISAILALGGFLGMGEKMVLIDYKNMSFDADREHLIVDLTEDQVDSMDDFKYNDGELFGRDISRGRIDVNESLGLEAPDQDLEWSKIEENWDEFKAAASEKWTDVTEDDWTSLNDDQDNILEVLKQRTGQSEKSLRMEINRISAKM